MGLKRKFQEQPNLFLVYLVALYPSYQHFKGGDGDGVCDMGVLQSYYLNFNRSRDSFGNEIQN